MLLSNDGRARLESVCALAGRPGSCDAGVDVECYLVDPASNHMLLLNIKPCMSFAKDVFINQERKLGARRRSDIVLVSTINDADQGSADVAFRTLPAPYEKSKFLGFGGSMVARLKLKGIDGRAPPGLEPAA
ncbi:putative domain-containing protein-like [Capsicum annuum]|nr:putative domain-containing protein-like [Capsicum annuum]